MNFTRFSDPAIRPVSEADGTAIAELFKLNYGDEYAFPEVYDGSWVKKSIYNDQIICVVLEENGAVIGAGAIILDDGDYNDQIGELARLVVDPGYKGRGAGHRIVDALFEAAQETVEFAFSEARTAHSHGQRMCEEVGMPAIGFVPNYLLILKQRESLVIYGKLCSDGASLRTDEKPKLVLEVAPLARHALDSLDISGHFELVQNCEPYPVGSACPTVLLDRHSAVRIQHLQRKQIQASVETRAELDKPLLFGNISVDQGFALLRRREAVYQVALDEEEQPIGVVGFVEDKTNGILKGVELIADDESVRGGLCELLLRESIERNARLVEVNISAYDPRLQKTFLSLGFVPAAYLPGMVSHECERLDVIKMVKLNVPYQPGEMSLTDKAREVLKIVESGLPAK